jgi:K+:H+ antiporter
LNHSGLFHDVLIFLLAAVVIVPLFHRLRTSPILGYLAAGMLIGPHGFAFIGDTQSAHTLAEFGVVFLLFMIGLDLSLERLRSMGRHVFGLGLLQVVVTGLLIGITAWSFGFDIKAAAIIGGALALSSTAFVLQLLTERGERGNDFGYFSFAILLLQDLAVVPLLIMVTTFSQEGSSFIVAFGLAIAEAAIALIIVTWAGRLILRPVFHMISSAKSAELFVAMTLLAVLGTGWLLSLTGLSMALGAFLAGLLLAETEYRHQVEADIRPFRGLLLGLFFMTIGMTINLGFIFMHLWLIAVLVLFLLIGKTIITSLLCRLFNVPTGISIKTGLALSQGGEFGFVIFGAAGALNLIPMETAQILLAVIALSMVVTPGLVHIGHLLSIRLKKANEDGEEMLNADFKADGKSVVIAGFGRVGQTIAKVLSDGDIPYVAIDADHQRVVKCRAQGMPVYYGDASQISVLNAAGAGNAPAIVVTLDQVEIVNHIVLELSKMHPGTQIFVRARDMKHLRKLETGGATAIVPETAEASLQLGAIVMNSLGISTDLSATIIENYREDDYAQLENIVGRSHK